MNLISWFLDLLYPPKCVFCANLLKTNETDLCGKCRCDLPHVTFPFHRGEAYEACYAAYYYEADVAKSVRKFKFAGRKRYAQAYGNILAMLILRERIEFDILSWVPISDKRARQRGYRQSKLIAQAIARELNIEAIQTLEKVKDNPAQSSLKKPKEREENVHGVYHAIDGEMIEKKRILLVDDVITSGATLCECARTLKKAGAKSVVCATLAATRN